MHSRVGRRASLLLEGLRLRYSDILEDGERQENILSLKLAESASELSELIRSEDPPYLHAIPVPYEQAVKAVTEEGYQRVAPYIKDFEDLRNHTYP